jgi:predicted CXXCH cytochrome family protein
MSKQQHRYHVSIYVTFVCVAGMLALYLLTVRGQAEAPKAVPAADFVGSETCAMCHEDVLEQVKKSPHGLLMTAVEDKKRGHVCEGCHGPGSFHVEDPSAETARPLIKAARTGAGCFQCHDKKLSRTDWLRSQHSRQDVACMACHGKERDAATPPGAASAKDRKAEQPAAAAGAEPAAFDHAAFTRVPSSQACFSCHTEKRAEFSLPSHHPVKEKRIECADCHDPHRPVTEKVKHDVCTSCHLGQRGPHLFSHGAISAKGLTDACLSCHLPHGSPNQRMLKLTNRGLCLQCHADRATHFVGRNCTDCHRAVHGSNTSSLLFRN